MDNKIIKQKIALVAKEIAEKYEPEKIILFGSYAWGTPTKDSDVDLFIVKDSKAPRTERQKEIKKSLSSSGLAMDLLVYTPEETDESINKNRNLFIEDIVRNGKVLYEKSKTIPINLPSRQLVILH